MKRLKGIDTQLDLTKKKILDDIQILREDSVKQAERITSVEAECADLKGKYENLLSLNNASNTQIRKLSHNAREKNLIIYKLDDSEAFNENIQTNVCDFLSKAIENFDTAWVVDVFRVGKTSGARPTLVCFQNKKFKRTVFSQLTKITENKFFIENDLTPDEMKQKSDLCIVVKKLKD